MTNNAQKTDTIAVLDFGSQYSHLIVRRIRELGVRAKLLPPETPAPALREYAGLILSGGPQNLSDNTNYEQDTKVRTSKMPKAVIADPRIYELGVPVLGICYGLQLIAHELGGRVRAGVAREYGPARVSFSRSSPLFKGLLKNELTWMSHGDQVTRAPRGFSITGTSTACRVAAMEDPKRRLYGIQFHPEVRHTTHGMKILSNFLALTGVKKKWRLDKGWIASAAAEIRAKVGKGSALLALSGGVDSTVAAFLTHRAIGKNLTCIYVDTGLMRLGETEQITRTFAALSHFDLRIVRAERQFLSALKGVTDPEQKRKSIGELFIRIFEREAQKLNATRSTLHARFLVQGTLYTDAITSGVSVGGKAAVIKSHHNVGGLPRAFKFTLIEPLRDLYKDEVRRIGRRLGVPEAIISRQPFPGPGLAVRIIGEVTKGKLEMLRAADAIFREELIASGEAKRTQQYFAVLPDVRSVGVQGDARTYGHPVVLRAVTTADFMTADFARIPFPTLARISARITNEVAGINRVVYDITSKPPGTVEWE